MANKLIAAKRIQVLSMLVDAGKARAAHHDATMCGPSTSWPIKFGCHATSIRTTVATAKAAPEDAGDVRAWTAPDADSRLIVSCPISGRDAGYAYDFIQGVAGRLADRVRLVTDCFKAYRDAVENAFGADVDHAQLVRLMVTCPVPGTSSCPSWSARTSPCI